MPDTAKIEDAEVRVAKLQEALDRVQQVLHAVDAVQKDMERIAKVLRIAGIALAVGGTAFTIAATMRRARRPS